MTEIIPRDLTSEESDAFADCESVIKRGIKTFSEVGNALLKIRDGRLYRADFGTFEDYCRERWSFSARRAGQLIEAAAIGTIVPVENEGQARELARVPEAERAEVWRETVERTGGKPTAAAIRETWRPPLDEPAEKPRPEADTWYGGPPDDDGPPEPAPLPDRQDEADAAVHRIERAAAETPPVAPDGPSKAVIDYIAADPAWQNKAYLASFAKAMTRSDDFMAFDPDRLGRIADQDIAEEVEQYLVRVEQFVTKFRTARGGLRIIQGGR